MGVPLQPIDQILRSRLRVTPDNNEELAGRTPTFMLDYILHDRRSELVVSAAVKTEVENDFVDGVRVSEGKNSREELLERFVIGISDFVALDIKNMFVFEKLEPILVLAFQVERRRAGARVDPIRFGRRTGRSSG